MSKAVDHASPAFTTVGRPLLQRLILAVFGDRFVSARWKLRCVIVAMAGLSWLLLARDPWIIFRLFSPDMSRRLHYGVSDKLHHFLGYLTLALCCIWYAAAQSRRTFLLISAAAAGHAIASELLQGLIPERTVDPGDFVANSAGVAAGVVIGLLVRRVLQRSRTTEFILPDKTFQQLPAGSRVEANHTRQSDRVRPSRSIEQPDDALNSKEFAGLRPRMINYRIVAILLAAAGVFFSSVFAIYGWQMHRNAESLIEAGKRPREDRDFSNARDGLTHDIGSEPIEHDASATLEGDFDDASQQLEKSLLNGEVSECRLADDIELLVEHADRDTAEQSPTRLQSQHPGTVDALRLETRLAVRHGEAKRALVLLQSFVDAAPTPNEKAARLTNAAGLANTVNTGCGRDADIDAAAHAFLTEAVQLDPRKIGQLVVCLLNHGRDVEAFERLDEVWQQLEPEAATGLSLTMLSTGPTHARAARVEMKLAAALKQRPNALLVKVCLADVQSLQRRYAEAESLYRQVLHVDPQNLPALNNLAWLLGMQSRETDEALSLIERAMNSAGSTPQLLETRACIQLAQGHTRQAVSDLQQAIVDGEATATILLHLAAAQLGDRHREDARQTFERSLVAGLNEQLLHPLDRALLQRLKNSLEAAQSPAGHDA